MSMQLKRDILIALLATLFFGALHFLFNQPIFDQDPKSFPGFTRLWFDYFDIGVYFQESRWLLGEGRLYVDVFSEYPLAPNLIFGFVRLLSETAGNTTARISGPEIEPQIWFALIWMSISFFFLVLSLKLLNRSAENRHWLLLLTPACIFFAINRFDIYPAFFIILTFVLLQRGRTQSASLALGVAISLKGFPLFFLPGYLAFLYFTQGFKTSFKNACIAVSPFILTHAAVYMWAGWDGLAMPYRFHLERGMNSESTFRAITFVIRSITGKRDYQFPFPLEPISQFIQILFALLPVVFRPRRFSDLLYSYLIAVVGFISAALFHSPQFLLWYVPVIAFTKSKILYWLGLTIGWITYLYFPIVFDGNFESGIPYALLVILMAAIQAGVILVALQKLITSQKKRAL
jgi:hypothetical protein